MWADAQNWTRIGGQLSQLTQPLHFYEVKTKSKLEYFSDLCLYRNLYWIYDMCCIIDNREKYWCALKSQCTLFMLRTDGVTHRSHLSRQHTQRCFLSPVLCIICHCADYNNSNNSSRIRFLCVEKLSLFKRKKLCNTKEKNEEETYDLWHVVDVFFYSSLVVSEYQNKA